MRTLFERMSDVARGNAVPWWEREGLTEPCPNWRPETRRCNCKDCRKRRRDAQG